jgi:hypothetical protein
VPQFPSLHFCSHARLSPKPRPGLPRLPPPRSGIRTSLLPPLPPFSSPSWSRAGLYSLDPYTGLPLGSWVSHFLKPNLTLLGIEATMAVQGS